VLSGVDGMASAMPTLDWSSELARSYDLALQRLNEKSRGELDVAIALAEAAELRQLGLQTRGLANRILTDLLGTFRSGFRKRAFHGHREYRSLTFKKGKRKRPVTVDDLTEWWLSYRYGVRPAMQDLYSALEEARRRMFKRKLYYEATARIPLEGSSSKELTVFGFGHTVKTDHKGFALTKFSVFLNITNDDLNDLTWTSLNPVNILWELTPYSFVFDWFFNVGGFLRGLETAIGFNRYFEYGYVTQLVVLLSTSTAKDSRDMPGINTKSIVDASGFRKQVDMNRTVLASYPFPQVPVLRVDLGAQQVLDAASLLKHGFTGLR
jgi:hypothetical protein